MSGKPEGKCNAAPTLRNLHVRDRLPLVHGDEPRLPSTSTAEIDDEFLCIVVERCKYSLKSLEREFARRKEKRSDDDLLYAVSPYIQSRVKLVAGLAYQKIWQSYFLSTPLYPLPCILVVDTAAHL